MDPAGDLGQVRDSGVVERAITWLFICSASSCGPQETSYRAPTSRNVSYK